MQAPRSGGCSGKRREIRYFGPPMRSLPVDRGSACARLERAAKWLFLLALLMSSAGATGGSSQCATVGCRALPTGGDPSQALESALRWTNGNFPPFLGELGSSGPEVRVRSIVGRRVGSSPSPRRFRSEYLLHVAPQWARLTRLIRFGSPQAAKREGHR